MRLVLFNNFTPGVLRGDNVVDVSGVIEDIPHIDAQTWMRGLIDCFDDYRGKLEDAAANSEGVPISDVRLRSPLPEPTRIACMAGNYLENGKLPFPTDREAFLKSPSAVIGDGDTVELPDAPVPHFHHEAELGLVIGKTSTDVPAEKAAGHIFGYLNFMDVSARGVNPNGGSSFFWGKSWDTFCPLGPVIVTADEVEDAQNLDIKLWVNGEVRQDHNTSDMGRTVEEDGRVHNVDHHDEGRRRDRDGHEPHRSRSHPARRRDNRGDRRLRATDGERHRPVEANVASPASE